MIKVQITDDGRMEEAVINLMGVHDFIKEIGKDLEKEPYYKELSDQISKMKGKIRESTDPELLAEYEDAMMEKAGLEANALCLDGIKTGFNLARALIGEPDQRQQDKPESRRIGFKGILHRHRGKTRRRQLKPN